MLLRWAGGCEVPAAYNSSSFGVIVSYTFVILWPFSLNSGSVCTSTPMYATVFAKAASSGEILTFHCPDLCLKNSTVPVRLAFF